MYNLKQYLGTTLKTTFWFVKLLKIAKIKAKNILLQTLRVKSDKP